MAEPVMRPAPVASCRRSSCRRARRGSRGVPSIVFHEEVVERIIEFASQNGFFVKNLEYSPIKGPEGNIEYLVYIRKDETGGVDAAVDIEAVVDAAHGELDK